MGKSEEGKARSAFTRLKEEIGSSYCEWNFIGEEQELEVVVSRWLQGVVSALLRGRKGSSLPFLKGGK